MKPNQIKNGFWKNAVVHFNGFQHKVIDFDGKDQFFIHDSLKTKAKSKWVHKDLIVWN